MAGTVTTEERTDRLADERLSRLLHALMQNCPIGLAIKDRNGRFVALNPALAGQLSTTVDAALGGADPKAVALAARLLDVDPDAVSAARPLFREVALDRGPDGVAMALVCHFPLTAADGDVLAYGSLVLDITERKRLEEQLAHAQKMDAIGRLTGGIAHDYNNTLGVISGNLELLNLDLPAGSPLRDYCRAALRAADRSADLTRRLLTFARRQTLRPKIVDVGELVTGLRALLSVTLRAPIEIQLVLEAGAHNALVDPGQLENALLNLAINSRDAMPSGGTFSIWVETIRAAQTFFDGRAEVPAGEYVRIVVADTGAGMLPETLSKAADPFFTTKGDRGGTGLGLSMVQGFASQSGGVFAIHSQISRGTEVRLYLPRVEAPEEAAAAGDDAADPPMPGSLRVLLVEDDRELGRTVAMMLGGLGYQVLLAEDAVTALDIVRGRSDIDLLLTDIMLPGSLSGVDVARRARDINPRLAVILATGYVEGAGEQPIPIPEDLPLLHKPFRLGPLDRAIREARRSVPMTEPVAPGPVPPVPLAGEQLDPTVIADRSFLNRCCREIRELFFLWERLKGNAPLPQWSSLDPFAIMPYLDSATLVEVRQEPLDFIYQASGRTEIIARGYDPAGRTVGEWHFGSTRSHVLGSYRYVATARSFLFDWETAISPTGKYIEDQTLFLPFTQGSEAVDKILVYSRLTRRPPRDLDSEFAI
jgi:signal transduction histidine kinase/CheY-like chemotaxis protein